jgi:hypothetical protein
MIDRGFAAGMKHRTSAIRRLAAAGCWLMASPLAAETMRPHIFLTAEPRPGLRSVADVRADIRSGRGRALWETIKQAADADLTAPVLVPTSAVPGRDPDNTLHGNRDYDICHAVGQRVLRAALANVLTQDPIYRDSALAQIEALYDPARWPEWRDLSHMHLTADLRTGQLTRDVALAYDWLHPALTPAERAMVVDGIHRRGIEPFWKAIENGDYWVGRSNNWMTCIVGGLGIAGMALGEDHPDSARLIEYSLPRLIAYLKIYGAAGEFNEAPGYASATAHPVGYFAAHRYHTGGGENRLAEHPFPEACRWLMAVTVPPGHCAAFGDTRVAERPKVSHVAAVAAASRDEILQGFYLQHAPAEPDVRDLVWWDPRVAVESPRGRLPLGRGFPEHGGCLVSRADWDPEASPCTVYGKAGREAHHADNDVGQVCIDGYGRRLIVDLGMPSMYPRDYFGEQRTRYYNASARGHNVLVVGARETRGDAGGRIVDSRFDDRFGASWSLDLTPAYDGVEHVRRTVVHRLPGVVAVLDEAETECREEIALRWHTANACRVDDHGGFLVTDDGVGLACRVMALDGGPLTLATGRHEYRPPYDRNRVGEPLRQRHEPYVQATLTAERCRLLSLFAVLPRGERPREWRTIDGGWSLTTSEGHFVVEVTDDALTVRCGNAPAWQADLRGGGPGPPPPAGSPR